MFEVTEQVEKKLWDKHGVRVDEVIECFINHTDHFLIDTREKHRTVPPTEWFIAETDTGRRLKVVFMEYPDQIVIKSAYEPSIEEESIYAAEY